MMGDEQDPTSFSDVNIEVWVSKRKASSIEGYHNEYVSKYGNDEYLSSVAVNENGYSEASEKDPPHASQHKRFEDGNQSLSKNPVCGTKQEELKTDKKPEAIDVTSEFWRGFGRNIYFHPMTCQTLPLKSVQSKQGALQKCRFSKRSQSRKKRSSSTIRYRMDVPSIQEMLSSLGTLQLQEKEDGETGTRSRESLRTGNFVMSSDSKSKLCKGFACRSVNDYFKERKIPSAHTSSWEAAKTGSMGVAMEKIFQASKHYVANSATPSGTSVKQHVDVGNYATPGVLSGKIPHFVNRSHGPRKKIIEGRAYHLTSSLQTINRVSLSPFKSPTIGRAMPKFEGGTSISTLYPSPEPSEDGDRQSCPVAQIVADHLQEIKYNDSNYALSSLPNEEHYAYDTALTYYVNKVGVAQVSKKLYRGLSAAGLHLEKAEAARLANLPSPRDPKNRLHQKPMKPSDLRDVRVTGRNLIHDTLASVHQTEISKMNNDPVDPLFLSGSSPPVAAFSPALPHVDTSYSERSHQSHKHSLDTPSESGKVVRFENTSPQNFLRDVSLTMPVEGSPAKLVDRYEIPPLNDCRLPIIGQRLTARIRADS